VATVANQASLDTLLANARLIAAAPELLEALERTLGELLSTGRTSPLINEAIGQARNVIQKARGQ